MQLVSLKKIAYSGAGIIIALIGSVVLPLSASAATAVLSTASKNVTVNQPFTVTLSVATDGADINASEGNLLYPSDLFSVKSVSTGGSVISFWANSPAIASAGKISFAGVILGGYSAAKGQLFSVTFLPKKAGSGDLTLHGMSVLLNDGKGTVAPLTLTSLSLQSKTATVTPTPTPRPTTPPVEQPTPASDTTPPELFTPEVSQSPDLFNNQWFLVFNAQDKESGIDRYEVNEGDGVFVTAQSPYLLQNQNRDTEIQVKAIDEAGNERVVKIPPSLRANPWYGNNLILLVIIGLAVIVLIGTILSLVKFYYERKKV